MTLKIKEDKDKEDNVIELERLLLDSVVVKIDGEVVATFQDNGKFKFFGQRQNNKYEGRWDE